MALDASRMSRSIEVVRQLQLAIQPSVSEGTWLKFDTSPSGTARSLMELAAPTEPALQQKSIQSNGTVSIYSVGH